MTPRATDDPLAAGLRLPYGRPEEVEVYGLLRDQVQRFLARSVDARAIDRAGRLDPSVREGAAAAGLFGLTISEAYGGAGLSLQAACSIVQALACHDRAVAILVGLHAGLGSRPLTASGNEGLRARYLPAMASGERVAAFAATEAGAGSDLTAVRTTASRAGEVLRLTGEKSYVTNGGFAGVFTVLAQTPGLGGARAMSLLCVPRETPGIEVGPEEDKLGIRGSSTVTVCFDGAAVPLDHLVGSAGRGMDEAHRALEWGRTLMAAGSTGTAQAALALTLAHVATRRQFGRPLREFPTVRAQVSDMAAQVFAMESLVRHAGVLEASRAPLAMTSLAAKIYASEAAWAVCDRAVQLHGALGFVESAGAARLLRDCRITRIFEGANDVLLLRGGLALLSTPASSAPLDPATAGPLGAPAAAYRTLTARLDAARAAARAAYGVGVVHQQLLLQALCRAEVCRAAAFAAATRGACGEDPHAYGLAARATESLVREGMRHLDDAARAVDDAAETQAMSAQIYGEDRKEPPQ